MLKRILIAASGLLLLLGLTAAPAQGGQQTAGFATLYEETGFDRDGAFVDVLEANVPTTCSAVPAEVSVVRSAKNQTDTTTIAFFGSSDTTCSNAAIAVLAPDDDDASIADAGYWMAVGS